MRGIAPAVSEALDQEMANNPEVFVLGDDVSHWGARFGFTGGLQEKYGRGRVIDAPAGGQNVLGLAAGAATTGLRPVVALISGDFLGTGFDQIYDHIATVNYLSGGQVRMPVTIVVAVGGGYGGGAQLSQMRYGLFAHAPGVKVVVPSTAYDAKGLTTTALADPNPVIIFGHRLLTGQPGVPFEGEDEDVPEDPYSIPFGLAAVRREGSDVTIVATAATVRRSVRAAAHLAEYDISAEVVDVRTLVPLDTDTIVASARKTGRVLVVDEDYQSFGTTGELTFRIQAGAFDRLTAPVRRVAVPDVPIPYSEPLEQAVIPNVERIFDEARSLAGVSARAS
nr:transketolase C-terminal domain-containing protein [Planosporangium flavigriseum]